MKSLNFTRNIFSILVLAFTFLLVGSVEGQVTIFSENMGSPSGTTAIATNTFQNNSPIIFSGTADVRSTTGSTGYSGSSGNGNVFFTNGEDIATSENAVYEIDSGLLKMSRNVLLIQGKSTISGNYLNMNVLENIAYLSGNVKTTLTPN